MFLTKTMSSDLNELIVRKHIFGQIMTYYDIRKEYVRICDEKKLSELVILDKKIKAIEDKKFLVKDDLITVNDTIFAMKKEISFTRDIDPQLLKMYYEIKSEITGMTKSANNFGDCKYVTNAKGCQEIYNVTFHKHIYGWINIWGLIYATDNALETLSEKRLKRIILKLTQFYHKYKADRIEPPCHGFYSTTCTNQDANKEFRKVRDKLVQEAAERALKEF